MLLLSKGLPVLVTNTAPVVIFRFFRYCFSRRHSWFGRNTVRRFPLLVIPALPQHTASAVLHFGEVGQLVGAEVDGGGNAVGKVVHFILLDRMF